MSSWARGSEGYEGQWVFPSLPHSKHTIKTTIEEAASLEDNRRDRIMEDSVRPQRATHVSWKEWDGKGNEGGGGKEGRRGREGENRTREEMFEVCGKRR